MKAYLLGSTCDLLEEEDVHCVQLRKVGLALEGQEVEHIPLAGDLLHDLIYVDL